MPTEGTCRTCGAPTDHDQCRECILSAMQNIKDELASADTEADTRKHMHHVAKLLMVIAGHLLVRADEHDLSKLGSEEFPTFCRITGKLKDVVYGSPEYKAVLKDPANRPAIDHHQKTNRHHPEYHDGISGMNLVDLLEMLCDWIAASYRHDDRDMKRSMEHCRDRWDIEPQLYAILANTARLLGEDV